MNPRYFSFCGGNDGPWVVTETRSETGEPLPPVSRLMITNGHCDQPDGGWALHGVVSNERYVMEAEKRRLMGEQQGLGRPASGCAALIPIKKSEAWWGLAQDERREIFEESSRHIAIGMRYLPAIARRLHHCRDLALGEPFDFLTWFEFAPEYAAAFDELLGELRATREWTYVEREVEVRVGRA